MRFSKLLMTILALTSISLTAQARGSGKERHGGDCGERFEKHLSMDKLKHLDLSDEQKAKLKELRKTHQQEGDKNYRTSIKEARKKFKETLRSNASKEEILKAYEDMTSKKAQADRARLDGLLSAREILTEEQRSKLFQKNKE